MVVMREMMMFVMWCCRGMGKEEAETWLRTTLKDIRQSPRMPRKTLAPSELQTLKVVPHLQVNMCSVYRCVALLIVYS
jgi:hypothetical protein